MNASDPFTGIWNLHKERSRFSTPPPQRWVIRAMVDEAHISIGEEFLRADGGGFAASAEANFDGEEYPVFGHPLADAFAYTRENGVIRGVGTKDGAVSLRLTLEHSGVEALLTLTYSIISEGREVAWGAAVFERPKVLS